MSSQGSSQETLVLCPICSEAVPERSINQHIDEGCPPPKPEPGPSLSASSSPFTKNTSARHARKESGKELAPIFSKKRKAHEEPESSSQILSTPKKPEGLLKSSVSLGREPTPKRPRQTINETLSSVAPLADKMRPRTLDEYIGQEAVIGKNSLLRGLVEGGSTGSLVLWGPPGSGKTTLARIIANMTGSVIKELSATSSGAADVRAVFEEAKNLLQLSGKKTVLFIDEIQRFNKAQQDIFLPYVEKGWIQLIAATTENPSFKVVGALLSRCRVVVLERLSDAEIIKILQDATARVTPSTPSPSNDVVSSDRQTEISGTLSGLPLVTQDTYEYIAQLAIGDARTALNLLELVLKAPQGTSSEGVLTTLKNTTMSRYDRSGDDRYDTISAMHKSLRGSDGSAAMYWLARMLTAGEDPLYVARRLIVVASEDVGLADPHALPLATATYFACQNIGMPECRINLAHCVAYLAEAPKSTRAYEAYEKAEAAAKKDPSLPVPLVIRNAPTKLMKSLGYGSEYAYNPSYAHPVINTYVPPELSGEAGRFLHKEGDSRDKIWNEDLLKRWEREVNGGERWEGRDNA